MSVIVDPNNTISTLNSRASATLAAGAVFTGVGEDVSLYGRAGIAITSSNASSGTLTIQVSHDNVNWSGPPRAWKDTRFAQPHMWNIVEKYFRIIYTNGTGEARDLSIQTQYSNNADILLGHQLDEVLLDETEALITRSLLVGKNEKGEYKNVGIDLNGLLKVEAKDEFTHLLTILVSQAIRTNQLLNIIAGNPLLDDTEDL